MDWREAVLKRDVKTIVKVRFGIDLTPTQARIVRIIAFAEHKRVVINCMTRYGKTLAVALGVALYISFNKKKRVYLISATDTQAAILRNYLADAISRDPILRELVHHQGRRELKDEMSKKRITLKNGCELKTVSAQGEANRLMGEGGDVVIVDESCLIKPEVFRMKISRMLGDSAESALIELSNPSTMDSHYFEHWNDPRYLKIHVGYQIALAEGRITQEFLDEQRDQLTPIEFRVLYESLFPDQAPDMLYDYAAVKACMEQDFDVEAKRVIISCDVADKGLDDTVIYKAISDGVRYKVIYVYSEPKTEQTTLAGRILNLITTPPIATNVNIDECGMGVGVLSMVKERNPIRHCKVQGCHFGRAARKPERFLNKKAEEYFRNAEIVNKKMICLPKEPKLVRDLLGIKWDPTSSMKIKIIDPENKSPDFSDALVYLTWTETTLVWGL